MAHFAQLDENNIVIAVLVISNDDVLDENGQESEAKGIEFCKTLYGQDTIWKQTSYNKRIRKNYAGVGFLYDGVRDAFIPPKLYPSFLLNEDTCLWEPPAPCPQDGRRYDWDEATLSWIDATPSGATPVEYLP